MELKDVKKAILKLTGIVAQDKQLHFFWCFSTTILLTKVGLPFAFAAVFILTAGAIKEYIDYEEKKLVVKEPPLAEHYLDMTANILGVTAAFFV